MNDVRGHVAGDKLLAAVGRTLSQSTRATRAAANDPDAVGSEHVVGACRVAAQPDAGIASTG